MELQIKQSGGGHITLSNLSKDIEDHFSNRSNCTKEITQQLNDLMYGFFFNKDLNNAKILDIGANIGLFSIHVADKCKKIYAVEPTPSHFTKLEELTKGLDNIEIFNYALSGGDKAIDFYLSGSNSTMNSLVNRDGGHKISVNGLKLDSLIGKIGEKHFDFCKIDIEGSEFDALTLDVINDCFDNIDRYFVEFHEVNGFNFDKGHDHFRNIFELAGYNVTRLNIDSIYATKN